ncbi:MAG: hypothetical protein H3C50_03150 [Kiritimatiellae bacterium]|nr:hypothetical protein [Kiritimatiellia bacterium]MCO5061445.1 FAD-binding oxidoreductase [Kiritimatiellia bacterium]MCO5067482.1 FAD-binding oxidoreductase [Kiritimatiellia bacterium]
MDPDSLTVLRRRSAVIANRPMALGAFELELSRAHLDFKAGAEIVIHGQEQYEDRIYSLANGERDPTLRLLIRLIPGGVTTPRLAKLVPGDAVEFTGPTGSFLLRDDDRPIWFIATGTGIAPLRSFVRTAPHLRPVVLHGVRQAEELYYRDELEPHCSAYYPCVSRDPKSPQRVTTRLQSLRIPTEATFYLCGSQPMIHDATKILAAHNIPADQIVSEPYFFW